MSTYRKKYYLSRREKILSEKRDRYWKQKDEEEQKTLHDQATFLEQKAAAIRRALSKPKDL